MNRLVVVAATLAVSLHLWAVPPALADAEERGWVCPESLVPASGIEVGHHTPSVDCANWWGIDIFPADNWASGRPATRAELAAVLTRIVDVTVNAGAGNPDHRFTDASVAVYSDEIGRLSDIGVINGFPDGTFGPDSPVRRDQMASMMMRLTVDVFGLDMPPAEPFPFVDVGIGTVHQDNISRIFGAGITTGVTSTTFDPTGNVTRGQAISFAVRILQALHENEKIAFGEVELDPPDLGEAGTPITIEGTEEAVGIDLATEDDPGANYGFDYPLGLIGGRHNNVAESRSWDYARHPLCTDEIRITIYASYDVGGMGITYLTFDEDHERRTGLASCVFSDVESNEVLVTIREYSREEWESLADWQLSFMNWETFAFAGGNLEYLPYLPWQSVLLREYEADSVDGTAFLIGDSAYVFERVSSQIRFWGLLDRRFGRAALHASGYHPSPSEDHPTLVG